MFFLRVFFQFFPFSFFSLFIYMFRAFFFLMIFIFSSYCHCFYLHVSLHFSFHFLSVLKKEKEVEARATHLPQKVALSGDPSRELKPVTLKLDRNPATPKIKYASRLSPQGFFSVSKHLSFNGGRLVWSILKIHRNLTYSASARGTMTENLTRCRHNDILMRLLQEDQEAKP